MFWDKKRKGGLPDLPRSPGMDFPKMPAYSTDVDEEEGMHELPAFPDSPMQKGFSQAAIKDAITQEDSEEHNDVEHEAAGVIPRANVGRVREMEEWLPAPSETPIQRGRENKPVFVRLDKFQLARSSLENVKVKIAEIENLLKQIREVKAREDQELSSWEGEMENVKARIQNVLSDIFDKTDY